MSAPHLILHQYDISPFSERVRIAFGIKHLSWDACDQPVIMPKPELVARTGGYRRIPILQIGADLYCDSWLILHELERRFPACPLFGADRATIVALHLWADTILFRKVVPMLFSGDWDADDAFRQDRSELLGVTFDYEARRAALPRMTAELRMELSRLEAQLADGRRFLLGETASAADAAVAPHIRFIRWGRGRTAALREETPAIAAWLDRVAALGHGQRGSITREAAIDVARAAGASADGADPSVRFDFADANTPILSGRLASSSVEGVVIHAADGLGTRLHLPLSAGRMIQAIE